MLHEAVVCVTNGQMGASSLQSKRAYTRTLTRPVSSSTVRRVARLTIL